MPSATSQILHLRVESARTWVPSGLKGPDAPGGATKIPQYHWLITEDDTGDPTRYGRNLGGSNIGNSDYACKPQSLGGDPDYPANCQWPSIHSVTGGTSGQVIAQGDEDDPQRERRPGHVDLPGRRTTRTRQYLISVIAEGFDIPGCTKTASVSCHADGFKIDGAWFTAPVAGNGLVTVDMQPYPLPLLTLRMKVWNDLQTNGAYDTGEPTLRGWEGHIDDVLGPVTTDWYGNPICTVYGHDTDGPADLRRRPRLGDDHGQEQQLDH